MYRYDIRQKQSSDNAVDDATWEPGFPAVPRILASGEPQLRDFHAATTSVPLLLSQLHQKVYRILLGCESWLASLQIDA